MTNDDAPAPRDPAERQEGDGGRGSAVGLRPRRAGREAGHTHGHGPLRLGRAEARRARIVLTTLVVPLVVATLVGLAVLWPGHSALIGSQSFAGADSEMATATVTSRDVDDCSDALASLGTAIDTSLLQDAVCARIDSGVGKGLILPVHVPAESRGAAGVGDRLSVLYSPAALASGTPYVFVDYMRTVPISALAIVYLVLVIAVAGWKGLRSAIGLVLASAVLVGFMIPALLELASPMWVTLVGCSAMMLVAVYIAHGVSIRTTTALLGTVAGVVITVLLSLWGVQAANLTGASDETAVTLSSLVPGLNLQTLLTCGMVIAGLGVLNDVTITQASAVWELHAANPVLGRLRLFAGGMRIGRDHIASTVYTLAFAYAGTALPLILSAALVDRSAVATLMSGEIAEEVVRTLVSSIGLVLAIPATTAIAAMLCAPGRSVGERREAGARVAGAASE